jgi:hypothetical protein
METNNAPRIVPPQEAQGQHWNAIELRADAIENGADW